MKTSLIALAILAGCAPTAAAESVSLVGEDTPVSGGSAHAMRVEADVSPRAMRQASAGVTYNPGTRARKRWKRARRSRS